MRQFIYSAIAIAFLLCFLCQCGGRHDARLARIAATVDSLPQAAIDSLAAIDTTRLSDADKSLHIFLLTKARDKAYVRHTSDSLILKAVRFYETDPGNPLYPEVLFYAGRVYNDMGDYPTALDYYLRSLDALPDTPDNLHLRGLIYGHLSWVLDAMRLHSQAIRYIKESLRIDSIENIGFNLAQDWQFLYACYMSIDSIDAAERSLKNAMKYATNLPSEDKASLRLSMARIKFKQDSIQSALTFVRGLQDKVVPDERNLVLAYLAEAYLKVGIRDSALMYAKELAWSGHDKNRQTGFRLLLSEPLISFIPHDSLMVYFKAYRDVINEYQKKHDGQQAVLQTSAYNYKVHVRLREKAEQRSDNLKFWLEIAAAVLLLSIVAILWLLLNIKSRKLKYYKLLREIEELKSRLIRAEEAAKKDEHEAIRDELRKKVLELTKYGKVKADVNPVILNSEAYRHLADIIRENDGIEDPVDKKELPEDNPLWGELEAVVCDASPDFFDTLERLAGGGLNRQEKMTVILIRCGVTPTQMGYLFRRKKGSISSRREQLGKRLFGRELKAQEVDNIIRGL